MPVLSSPLRKTKGERDLSWFEDLPTISLEMMEAAGLTAETCVIDVGGGESRLVDALLAKGLDCLAVLDVKPCGIRNHAWARHRTWWLGLRLMSPATGS